MGMTGIITKEEYEEYLSIVNSMMFSINERSRDYILFLELREKIERYELSVKSEEKENGEDI